MSPASSSPIGPRLRTGCGVLVAVLALGGFTGWYFLRPAPPPSYDTQVVDTGDVVSKVTATGVLSALVTVQVGTQVSGRIASLNNIDFNSKVEKGQLIASLDPEMFQAALEQARAADLAANGNLTKAKVQAADAARVYARAQSLADRSLIAAADRDTAQAAADAANAGVEVARGQVAQAHAALHQAQVNLAYTSIVSPINGTVISRSVDVGQTVAASLSAPTLFVIAEDLAKMQVDTSVAEADIGRLADKMKATFTVDAWPGRHFDGTVRQIRNAPTSVQSVVTYDAVVDVTNTDLALKPGMTANVTFVVDEKDAVVRIPNVALRFHLPDATAGAAGERAGGRGGRRGGGEPEVAAQGTEESHTIYVLRDGKPVAVSVQTGLSDGRYTELKSGELKVGDEVITDVSEPGAASRAPSGASASPFRRGM